jgi:hypothetical protein
MFRTRLPMALALISPLALTAGAACAQAPMSFVAKGPAISMAQSAQKPLDLSTAGALNYARRAQTPLPPGVARTAVERGASDLTGSAGLLCGLQPSADTSGAATARGYDPDGKFVGAKLALRF